MIHTQELKGTFPALPESGKYEMVTDIWNREVDVHIRSTVSGAQWSSMLSQLFADVPDATVSVVNCTDDYGYSEMQTVRISGTKFQIRLSKADYKAAMEYRESIAK